jgi:antitoxin component YwqK of YwqJK toxin-antitoxin module
MRTVLAIVGLLVCGCSKEQGTPESNAIEQRVSAAEVEELQSQISELEALAGQRLEMEKQNTKLVVSYWNRDDGNAHYRGYVLGGEVRTGIWTYWRQDGSKEREGSYANGVKDGPWMEYESNGQETGRVMFADGEEVSRIAVAWHSNGVRKSELPYVSGELHGIVVYWHDNGNEEARVSYRNGKRDGLDIRWFSNGKKKEEGRYVLGEVDGSYRTWYESGRKETEAEFKAGEIHGSVVRWFESGAKGEEAMYSNGELSGTRKKWFENGQIAYEGQYEAGELVSLACWTEDGARDGHVVYNSCRGLRSAGEIVVGLRHGLWSHTSDRVQSEEQWVEGMRGGICVDRVPDGSGGWALDKEASGIYENGRKVRDLTDDDL